MKRFIIINKRFTKLIMASTISRFGDSVDTIAFSWLVYVITGSKVLMGAVFAVSYIPNLIVLPFGGVIADLFNKKVITTIGDFLRAFSVLLLAFIYFYGQLEVYMIFIFVVLNSLFESFANPSRRSMLQSIVDQKDYLKGSSYLSSATNLGGLVGLAIAGGVIAIAGISGALLLDATTFLVSGILILTIRFKDKRKTESNNKTIKNSLSMIKEGALYLKGKTLLITILILGSFINFAFVPLNVLRPIYVTEVMELGVEGLSYLAFSILFGMTIGGLLMGKFGKNANPIQSIGFGILCIGLTYSGLGVINYINLSYNLNIIIILLTAFTFGLFFPVVQAPFQSVIMTKTDPKMIGRLSSIMGMLSMISLPLGGAVVSLVGDAISVSVFFTIMGTITILISSIFWFKYKQATL
ncbi:MAG: MFS transporter [Candidatus Izimaplasma sp.]|nr:MFS transporter [Candidatus Izimaplasma bacterium]